MGTSELEREISHLNNLVAKTRGEVSELGKEECQERPLRMQRVVQRNQVELTSQSALKDVILVLE